MIQHEANGGLQFAHQSQRNRRDDYHHQYDQGNEHLVKPLFFMISLSILSGIRNISVYNRDYQIISLCYNELVCIRGNMFGR